MKITVSLKDFVDSLTFSQKMVIKAFAQEFDISDGVLSKSLVISNIKCPISNSQAAFVSCMKLLKMIGVIETVSRGSQGTYVRIKNPDAFSQIICLCA